MHSAPSVDEGLRFRTRPTTSNANHRRTPLDWYPFPKVQNKIKSDQCRQYRQLIIYYFIVSLMCVGTLMSSSGSSYFQLFRAPPGRKLAVSGCFSATGGAVQVASPARGSWSPTQQSRESHGILHLTYSMFPGLVCVQKQLKNEI